MRSARTARTHLRALALAAQLLLPGAALAEVLALRYEPLFTLGERSTTDAAGATTEADTTTWTHLLNLRLDRALAERLRLSASTNYEWGLGTEESGGRISEFDNRTWVTHVQLTAGGRELNLTPFYSRLESTSDLLRGGARTEVPRRVRDVYGAYGNWRPDELPAVSLRLSRTEQEQGGGALLDTTTTQASADVTYALEHTELRYRLEYQNPVDHLAGVDSVSVGHHGRVGYADRFLGDRLALSGTYTLSDVTVETRVSGAGGTVETRQALVAGLSAIEAPPATPTSITLARTPALVDGDRAAGVGINVGFRPSAAGDTAPRHVGAQLANAVTPVNAIHLWVDRPLPAGVAGAYAFAAYRSDDNLSWTAVPLAGPVVFGVFDDRFEIPIERTSARYLKVVTRPLSPGTTLDARFADVLVTEIELLDLVPAAAARGRTSRTSGIASAALRAKLLAHRRLFYDLATNLTHTSSEAGATEDSFVTWDVTNGLSYDQALGRFLTFTSRVERTDSHQRFRDDAVTRVSASLGAAPLPTLSSTATYSGSLTESEGGRIWINSVLAFLQAQPYQGLALQASASYGIGAQAGQQTRTHSEAVSVTVTPHAALTLSGTFTQYASRLDAAGVVQQGTRRVEGGVTFAPVQAVYLAASIGRVEIEDRPSQRVSSVAVNVRPFPRGTLYLSLRYEESYDSLFDTRTRTMGPSLRWNIHAGNYLEASYTVQDTTSSLLETHLNLLAAKLTVSL